MKKSKISKTKINKRMKKKTDPALRVLIRNLKKNPKPLCQRLAKYLSRPRRKAFSVNIEKINKLTETDSVVVVPGKVLSKGNLDHKITLAAYKFSDESKKKLDKKADLLSISELIEKVSAFKGINIRIII